MPSSGEITTVIGPDTHVKGEIAFASAARILGQVDGQIVAQGRLEIGHGAVCKASIDAATLVIEGTVEGNVRARERLELTASAVVKGDLVAARLIAAEGSAFTGQCAVGDAAQTRAPAGPARIVHPPTTTTPIGPTPAALAVKPTTGADLEGALAGLESKLAGFARARALSGER